MYKDDMLGKLLKGIVGLPAEMIGTLYDLIEKLGGEDGDGWWAALKRFLRKENPWEKPLFKYDKTEDGWTLLEDTQFSDSFTPDFVSFLRPGENQVGGDVMRSRAKELNANLGQRDLQWLEANQHLIPESERGYYIVVPGTVWSGIHGGRRIACLVWDEDHWYTDFYWLGRDWNDRYHLLCLRK